jgi:hypothetical protein
LKKVSNSLWKELAKRRSRTIRHNLSNPVKAQEAVFQKILRQTKDCKVGIEFGLDEVSTIDAFRISVPVTRYSFWKPHIAKIIDGGRSIMFNGLPSRIAQTGGTTAAPKRIPLSPQLIRSYRQFNLDMALCYMEDSGNYDILSGKIFIVASNPEVEKLNGVPVGFIAGIMAQIAFWPIRRKFVPDIHVIRNPNMEEKIAQITDQGLQFRDTVHISAGLTTYLMSGWVNIICRMLELEGQDKTIGEIFPHLKVAFHGGSTYDLYLERMKNLAGDGIDHRNVYSAAEGPIAFQQSGDSPGLTPALDGVFFEFIPQSDAERDAPDTLLIDEVKSHTPYYILLTTQGGLLRYRIGDLVEFIQTHPPLLRVLGKSSEEIDLSAEKIGVDQAARAISEACKATDANLVDFMVCPKKPGSAYEKIAHEWTIEFEKPPADLEDFRRELEKALFSLNPMYHQLREHNFALGEPIITTVPIGTFQRFAERELSYGQQKIVHMHMDRRTVDRVNAYAR